MKKRLISFITVFGVVALLLAGTLLWSHWENHSPEITRMELSFRDLPEAFSGLRVAQISDLHNSDLGQDALIELLREESPDLIAITGDMIDSRRTDVEKALAFARQAVTVAPCYYVTGNHESRAPLAFARLEQGLAELGVTVLRDERLSLEREGEIIYLLGLDDPAFFPGAELSDRLNRLTAGLEEEAFTLLLSHRPELAENYAEAGLDLSLTGHVHGGQIRFPGFGAIYGPNQGLFPQYFQGVYRVENHQMVVSRGIGNSLFQVRLNCRPEVIVIELTKEA